MAWTADELARIEGATELRLASRRSDGTPRPFVTIWVVRAGDDVYVRSAYGHANAWFRRAQASGEGQIRAGGVERDVVFEEPRRRWLTLSTPRTMPSTTATDPGSSEPWCRPRPPGRRSGSSLADGAPNRPVAAPARRAWRAVGGESAEFPWGERYGRSPGANGQLKRPVHHSAGIRTVRGPSRGVTLTRWESGRDGSVPEVDLREAGRGEAAERRGELLEPRHGAS
jgi:hypothetical protein